MAGILHLFFQSFFSTNLNVLFPLFLGNLKYRFHYTNTPTLPKNEDPDEVFTNLPKICSAPKKGSIEQKKFQKGEPSNDFCFPLAKFMLVLTSPK